MPAISSFLYANVHPDVPLTSKFPSIFATTRHDPTTALPVSAHPTTQFVHHSAPLELSWSDSWCQWLSCHHMILSYYICQIVTWESRTGSDISGHLMHACCSQVALSKSLGPGTGSEQWLHDGSFPSKRRGLCGCRDIRRYARTELLSVLDMVLVLYIGAQVASSSFGKVISRTILLYLREPWSSATRWDGDSRQS